MTSSKNNPNVHYNIAKRASSHQEHLHREKPRPEQTTKVPSSALVNRIQTNKILELQLEALEKKLGEKPVQPENIELDRLRRQVKEKDAELQRAQQKISELKKQLQSLEEKARAHQKPKGEQKKPGQPEQKQWKQAPAPAAQKGEKPHRRHH